MNEEACASHGCQWKERGDALELVSFSMAALYPPAADFTLTLCALHTSAVAASPAARISRVENLRTGDVMEMGQ